MNFETYKHAPITEAALDIRVTLGSGEELNALESLTDDEYPKPFRRPVKVELRLDSQGAPGVGGQLRAEASNTPLGFSYLSRDEKNVFQVRVDGFTCNRLAPYESWGVFSAEARRLWDRYRSDANPKTIELLGLNYVNHVYVPDGAPFQSFLRSYVEVPKELPQNLNTFTLGFQSTWPGGDDIRLFIGQAIAPPMKPGMATVALSIQAFKIIQKKALEVGENEIWGTFEKLRVVKNTAFEACITDLLRKEFR